MKKWMVAVFMTVFCIPLWGQQTSTPDLAAQNAALEQKVRDLEDRLISLEGKVRILQSAPTPPAQPTAEGQPAAAPPTAAAAPQAEPQAAHGNPAP